MPDGRCGWCGDALPPRHLRWCSKRCRQAAWRMRGIIEAEDRGETPKRLAYADPPYPGEAWRYKGHPDYAGEVDHEALIASLVDGYDGWALSTSEKSVRDLMPLCPPEARIGAWCKANGAAPSTRGPHNSWEPVIYVPARLRRPGVRDYLICKPARGGGDLVGRKPLKFCAWIFALLGAAPVDDFADLFPGTGIVGRAWGEYVRAASLVPGRDATSREVLNDADPPTIRGAEALASGSAASDAEPPGSLLELLDVGKR